MGYSEEIISQARAEYESGYYSVKTLPVRNKYGISTRTVEKWVDKGGWVKGRHKPEIEERKAVALIDAFSQAGMPTDKAVSLTVTGMLAGSDVAERMVKEYVVAGGVVSEELTAVIQSYVTNLSVRQKYLDLYFKITGQIAPQVVEQRPPDKPYDLSRLSDDELRLFISLREKCER